MAESTCSTVLLEAVHSWRSALAMWGALLFAHDTRLCAPALEWVKIFPTPIILGLCSSALHSLLAFLVAFMIVPEGLVLEWPWGTVLAPQVKVGQRFVGRVLRPLSSQLGCTLASLYLSGVFLMTQLVQTKDHPYLGLYHHIEAQRYLGLWSLWVFSELLCLTSELSLRLLFCACGCHLDAAELPVTMEIAETAKHAAVATPVGNLVGEAETAGAQSDAAKSGGSSGAEADGEEPNHGDEHTARPAPESEDAHNLLQQDVKSVEPDLATAESKSIEEKKEQ